MNTKFSVSFLLAAVCFSSFSVYAQLPPAYEVTILPIVAADINNAGQVVGENNLWDHNVIVHLPGDHANAQSINNFSQIAGSTSGGHAVVWSNGMPTLLQPLYTGGSAQALGINDAGRVVGVASLPDRSTVPVVWDGVIPTPLRVPGSVDKPFGLARDINNKDQIAGYVFMENENHAVIWDGNSVNDLTPNSGGFATSINDSGEVVGSGWHLDNSELAAFLWDKGVLTVLDKPGDDVFSSFAFDINNNGLIVGSADNPVDIHHAVIWDKFGVHDLNSLVDPKLHAAGWVLGSAIAINDKGQIVGLMENLSEANMGYYLLTPVPEPGTYSMLTAGLSVIGFAARRRKAAFECSSKIKQL